jgi:hypothetical protein
MPKNLFEAAPFQLIRVVWFACISASALFLSSCKTPQAQWDATHLRTHAIDYYNDQIMENLIRATHGLAFVHVDVTGLNATASQKLGATFNGGQSITNTGTNQTSNQTAVSNLVTTTVATVASLAHAATRPLTFGVSPERSNLINYNTVPLFGNIPVYDAYDDFLKQASVKVDDGLRAPSKGTYVPGTLKRWDDGRYYYIGAADQDAYRTLCMKIFRRQPKEKPQTLEDRQRAVEDQLKQNRNDLDQIRSQQLLNE